VRGIVAAERPRRGDLGRPKEGTAQSPSPTGKAKLALCRYKLWSPFCLWGEGQGKGNCSGRAIALLKGL